MQQRSQARVDGDAWREKDLHKTARKSAKQDKSKWLENALATGSWKQVRNFRSPRPAKQGRLRDVNGEL
eukprot:7575001-Pyramimonas_sp.AAC.1